MPLPDKIFEKAELAVTKETSPLKAESAALLDRAKTITVTDNETLKVANEVKTAINKQASRVKELRLELTRPIDAFKGTILSAEKDILLDLDTAKNHVAGEILGYEEKLEAEQRAEAERIQTFVEMLTVDGQAATSTSDVDEIAASLHDRFELLSNDDRVHPAIKEAVMASHNRLESRKEQIVAEEKAAAERARLAEEAKTQSVERQKIAAEQARIQAERDALEADKRQIERKRQEQELEAQRLAAEKEQAKRDAEKPKSNIVVNHDFEVTDESVVPAEYRSVDEKKIRAAIKAGVREIPGVTITEKKVVR